MRTLSIFRNLLYVYLEYQERYQGLNFRVGAVKYLTFCCKQCYEELYEQTTSCAKHMAYVIWILKDKNGILGG